MTQDSGTPRVDGQLVRVFGKTGEVCAATTACAYPTYVPADFARQFEREVNAATAQLRLAHAELSQSRVEVERLREALQLAAQVLRDTQLIGDDQRAGKFFCCECARYFDDPDKPEHEPQCAVGRALETARAALREPAKVERPKYREVASAIEPDWIVNDLGELGVKVGERLFFLYKGGSIEYIGDAALHEDGSPMLYRPVGKREFGETCQPLQKFRERHRERYLEPLIWHEGLSFGKPEDAMWRPINAAPADRQETTNERKPE